MSRALTSCGSALVRRLVVKAPERATFQEAGGTFPRFALLAVIGIGVLGAVAIRLLLASALTLLLLLAPGDAARAGVWRRRSREILAWFRRLVGAIAAKLIYAVSLAVVVAAARTFTRLGIGWFGTWLVLGAFWWGVRLKRHDLVGFVSAGTAGSSGRGQGALRSQATAWR